MKDQIVSLDTAKLAKEKGFTQRKDEEDLLSGFICGQCWVEDLDGTTRIWGDSNAHSAWAAPTQSLLQKWLREKHNCFVKVDLEKKHDWWYILLDSAEGHHFRFMNNTENHFKTFEEALEAGLQEALKLIQ